MIYWLALLPLIWMFFLFGVERLRKEADIVDLGWAFGIGALAIGTGLIEGTERGFAAAIMGGVWGLRLTLHLYFNRFIKEHEDSRYAELRQNWDSKAFFLFFQAQGILIFLFTLPYYGVAIDRRPLDIFFWLGSLIWLVSIFGEFIADKQLENFKKKNTALVCKEGLWRYSRHPNYFFEWLHWLAYPVMTFGSDNFWLTLHAPILMLYLILKVTGIPPIEDRALKKKGDEFRQYMKETNAFFPWLPRL